MTALLVCMCACVQRLCIHNTKVYMILIAIPLHKILLWIVYVRIVGEAQPRAAQRRGTE